MTSTKHEIEHTFRNILNITANTAPVYGEGGKARIGAWQIDNAACYGGYIIEEIVNEGGAVRHVGGYERKPAREFLAFLQGIYTVLKSGIKPA